MGSALGTCMGRDKLPHEEKNQLKIERLSQEKLDQVDNNQTEEKIEKKDQKIKKKQSKLKNFFSCLGERETTDDREIYTQPDIKKQYQPFSDQIKQIEETQLKDVEKNEINIEEINEKSKEEDTKNNEDEEDDKIASSSTLPDPIVDFAHLDGLDTNPLKIPYENMYGNKEPKTIDIQDLKFQEENLAILKFDDTTGIQELAPPTTTTVTVPGENYGIVDLPCLACVDEQDKRDSCQEQEKFEWYHDRANFITSDEYSSSCKGKMVYSNQSTLQCETCQSRFRVNEWKMFCESYSDYTAVNQEKLLKHLKIVGNQNKEENFIDDLQNNKQPPLEKIVEKKPQALIVLKPGPKESKFKDIGKEILAQYPNISNDFNHPDTSNLTKNHFFNAFYLAYGLHGQLVLSPDDVWLQISMQFAKFVNDNAEELRYNIVNHEGKKEIQIKFSYLQKGFDDIRSDEFRWDIFCKMFQKKVKENTKNQICETLENDFTSTGNLEKCASYVTTMHSCEKFFKYKMVGCGCGITKAHFLGEEQDWEKIKSKIDQLKKVVSPEGKEHRLDGWFDKLKEIIDNFLISFRGDSNVDFWNKIVEYKGIKKYGASGNILGYENGISGWLRDFFIYDSKNKFMGWGDMKNGEKQIKLERIGTSEIKTPVILKYDTGARYELFYLSGFTSSVEKDGIFRPQMSVGFSISKGKDEEKIEQEVYQ